MEPATASLSSRETTEGKEGWERFMMQQGRGTAEVHNENQELQVEYRVRFKAGRARFETSSPGMSKSSPHGTAGRGGGSLAAEGRPVGVLPDSSEPSPARACHSTTADFKAEGTEEAQVLHHGGQAGWGSSPGEGGFTGQVPNGSEWPGLW
ncbi:UNVERIFIED_CONTAM: hypothetical protein K2H54_046503 [Gekko kuhli]